MGNWNHTEDSGYSLLAGRHSQDGLLLGLIRGITHKSDYPSVGEGAETTPAGKTLEMKPGVIQADTMETPRAGGCCS